MNGEKMIGVVGGLGPYAGLDLVRKIFDETQANTDQEHLPVLLLSASGDVADRTEFLLGRADTNPAHALCRIVRQLESAGADVVGMPCNTAHAPPILDVLLSELRKADSRAVFVHMIDEVKAFLREHHPELRKVGLLCTTGTCASGIYDALVKGQGSETIRLDETFQQLVHSAMYDPASGIKAQAGPVSDKARQRLLDGVEHLRQKGAEAVVLGCTEIPLAVTEKTIGDLTVIDPTRVLARALIREAAPGKLKPLEKG